MFSVTETVETKVEFLRRHWLRHDVVRRSRGFEDDICLHTV
jgi:hypothetical protein